MLRGAHFRSHCGAKKVDAGVLVLRGEVGSQVAGAVGRRVESGQVSDGGIDVRQKDSAASGVGAEAESVGSLATDRPGTRRTVSAFAGVDRRRVQTLARVS